MILTRFYMTQPRAYGPTTPISEEMLFDDEHTFTEIVFLSASFVGVVLEYSFTGV
jgi:hypothetical protein